MTVGTHLGCVPTSILEAKFGSSPKRAYYDRRGFVPDQAIL